MVLSLTLAFAVGGRNIWLERVGLGDAIRAGNDVPSSRLSAWAMQPKRFVAAFASVSLALRLLHSLYEGYAIRFTH